jgi:putative colanic acid biosysnthesis UDP-glucose lipid carrier transferase
MSRKPQRLLKRLFDIAIAAALLALLLPLMIAITGILYLYYQGNPFFMQRRTGFKGKEFTIYKFRTLLNPLVEKDKPLYVSQGDIGISPFGHMLRKTGIDELPQLFNVLKGEMSLVGPRPQPINHLSYYTRHIPDYKRRHDMPPGLTGLVQVSPLRHTMGEIEDVAERVGYDLYYVDHWSLWLDLAILVKTIARILGFSTTCGHTRSMMATR